MLIKDLDTVCNVLKKEKEKEILSIDHKIDMDNVYNLFNNLRLYVIKQVKRGREFPINVALHIDKER